MNNQQLAQGLDVSGQRRLWLLQMLVEKIDPEQALQLAERMEHFILSGAGFSLKLPAAQRDATISKLERPDVDLGSRTWAERVAAPQGRNPSRQRLVADAGVGPVEPLHPTQHEIPERPPSVQFPPTTGRGDGRLLAEEAVPKFIEAIDHGATNDELARVFGITRRQANGLRMGLVKRMPHLGSAKPPAQEKPKLGRETELQMQEDFLKARTSSPTTLDDVVRFLRQRGDIVVRAGDDFAVNDQTLTASELVDRANRKRLRLGRPPFPEVGGGVTLNRLQQKVPDPIAASAPCRSEQPIISDPPPELRSRTVRAAPSNGSRRHGADILIADGRSMAG